MPLYNPNLTHQIAGNTAGATANIATGTYQLAGGNNITLSQNANSVTISAGAGGGGGGFASAGLSNIGNTAGNTGLVSNQLVLAGGNNITLSGSTNGGSATVTVSTPTQTNQTANFYVSSNSTQLSSTAGIDLRSVTFQGAGIASVGVSEGKVLVSVPSGGGAGDGGNVLAAGTRTAGSNSTVLFSNSNNISFGLNTTDGSVMTASYNDAKTYTRYNNVDGGSLIGSVTASNGTLWLAPFTPYEPEGRFPGNMTVSTMNAFFSGSHTATNASTGTHSKSWSHAFFTRDGNTLRLVFSASTSVGTNAANASVSSLYHGLRVLSYNSSQFSDSGSNTVSLTFAKDSVYYIGVHERSSGTDIAIRHMYFHYGASAQMSGTVGTSTATNGTMFKLYPFHGVSNASFSSAMPSSINLGSIQHNAALGQLVPVIALENSFSRY